MRQPPTLIKGIPDDLMTSDRVVSRRVKVSTTTREEIQITKGNFYVGFIDREEVPTGDVFNVVVQAGVDSYLVFEDTIIEPDFQSIESGQFSFSVVGYVESSNANSWDYTEGQQAPVGRSLSTEYINTTPSATIDPTANITNLSGVSDYPVFFADYFISIQGGRVTVSTTGSSFFEKGRQILLAPNEKILIQSTTTGVGTVGTLNVKTIFFTSEVHKDDL